MKNTQVKLLIMTLAVMLSVTAYAGCIDNSDNSDATTTYTITAIATTGGTVTGGGTYEEGTSITLVATPSAGYLFIQWSDGRYSTNIAVTVDADKSLTATFRAIDGTTIDVENEDSEGWTSVSQSGTVGVAFTYTNGVAIRNYEHQYGTLPAGLTATVSGSTLTISGTPTESGTFESWYAFDSSGYTWGYKISLTIIPATTTYTITTTAGTGGTVTGGGTYNSGTSITITATPSDGYAFSSWNDGNTTASRAVTVTGNATYTATFTAITTAYTITTTAGTGGTVTGGGTYNSGTSITITATPSAGYFFLAWNDGVTPASSRTVTVTANATYTATFMAINGTTISVENGDAGGWTSVPLTGNVGVQFNYTNTYCWRIYEHQYGTLPAGLTATVSGSTLTISGTPTESGTFESWYAFDSSGYTWGYKISLTIGAAITSNTLTVTAGTGGTVTGGGVYNSNVSITITATADTGYTFASWNDGNTSPIRSVMISADTTYTATFTPNTYTLTTTAGTGGTVTGGGSYQYNTTATLVATADTGYSFVSWNDGNTNSSRTVTVTAAKTYTASFAALDTIVSAVTATVTAPVTGATPVTTITISSTSYTVGAPTWTPTVSSAFASGTVYSVSFTVTAADGYAINSTTTATVNSAEATITSVNGTYTVTYTFPATLITYTVTYSAGTTTTAVYTEGTPLILRTAPVIEHYLFIGWNTAQGGTGTNVGIAGESYTPTADITLYATYVDSSRTITFDANGGTTSTASKSVATGYAVGSLPIPTYADHIFVGWNTASDGTGTAYTSETVYDLTTDLILYAQWTASSDAFAVSYTAPTSTDPTVSLTATIAFLGESVDMSAATYNWYVFQDGSSTAMTQGFQRTFSYTFTESGTYTIKVVVNSSTYGSADYEDTVTIVKAGGGGEDPKTATPAWVYVAYAVSIICGVIAAISIFAARFDITVVGALIAVAVAIALQFGGYLL